MEVIFFKKKTIHIHYFFGVVVVSCYYFILFLNPRG